MAVEAYRAELDAGQRFLETIDPGETVVLVFHGDADGLCSAAIMYRTLLEIGDELAFPEFMTKTENLYSESLNDRILARGATRLIVMDTGSRPRPIIHGLPTMVIDHHKPEGRPPVEVFATSFGLDPPSSASLITYQICKEFSRVGNLGWLAAVGTAGDLGIGADLEILRDARERYTARAIKETVTLINAARRAPAHDVPAAFNALIEADSPLDIIEGRVPETPTLTGYRQEVNSEFRRAVRTKPEFSGRWALLAFDSPALVHGMVAAAWAHRLPENLVISANYGYTEGRVYFSVRTLTDTDLIGELQKFREVRPDVEFGHGYPQASGGILPLGEFQEFLAFLGFPQEPEEYEPGP